ncbi:hypothetical protein M2335_001251 [Sphingobium sp. B12D2B]|nr:hypothetical protein [Sphingobium sp. B12D2B]
MTLEQIAVRSAVIWLVGIVAYAALNAAGATADRRLSGVPRVAMVLASVASIGAIFIGCYGAGLLVRNHFPERGTDGAVAVGLTVVVGVWASSIVAQVARNYAFRLVGLKPEPVQWYRGQKRKGSRKKKSRKS